MARTTSPADCRILRNSCSRPLAGRCQLAGFWPMELWSKPFAALGIVRKPSIVWERNPFLLEPNGPGRHQGKKFTQFQPWKASCSRSLKRSVHSEGERTGIWLLTFGVGLPLGLRGTNPFKGDLVQPCYTGILWGAQQTVPLEELGFPRKVTVFPLLIPG